MLDIVPFTIDKYHQAISFYCYKEIKKYPEKFCTVMFHYMKFPLHKTSYKLMERKRNLSQYAN